MRDSSQSSTVRRIGRKLLARPPALHPEEEVVWEHGCTWNKNGVVGKAGFLFITNQGRLIWRSGRHDAPRNEWIHRVADIQSVRIEKGNLARKASAPFAAGLRTLCVIEFTNGDVESVFPSSISQVLTKAMDLVRGAPDGRLNAFKSEMNFRE